MARNLDTAALRSFVAIADTNGVTSAAAQVNLTQSAVSMQIKRLEDTFGAKLLLRQGRGVAMTPLGEQLLTYARRIISLNDETWMRLTNDDYEGDVSIGVPADIIYPHIPQILKRSTELYPRVRIRLISSLTKSLKQRFKSGELDLILTTEKRAYKGSETLQIAENIWYGARQGKAHLQDPLPLSICNNCAQKSDIIRSLDQAGRNWTMVSESDTDDTQMAIVSADLAVAPRIRPEANLVALPPGTLPELGDVWVNMYQSAYRDTRLIEKVADVVRDVFRTTATSRPILNAVG